MEEPTASNGTPGLRAGSRFGHYRLKRLLGRGGFGEVYEAEDTMMDRVVALKLLAAPYSRNEVFRQRLYREARNAGKLHEPHVVPIHHCGEIDGQLYIDMRLIEGTDLQKVLARDGPLSPARAVAIVRQIAAALDAAHSVQMVHRDIKPANILLTGGDFACLVDFGLANAATDAHLTSSGTTIGTFAYMAPERFSNTEVSHRADIYALACVLYECLTGVPPYPTGDLPALINAHLTAPVPRPSQHRPQIPAGFDDVIAVGLAKNPKNRFASASDLAAVARHALRPAGQRQADAIVASTQAARQPDHRHAVATAKPPAGLPAKTPRPSAKPASSPAKTPQPSARPAPLQRLGRRKATALAALAALAIISVVLGVTIGHWSSHPSQVELAFIGLSNPSGVAVDTAGNVYVVDAENRVLELPRGTNTQVALPFTDLNRPAGVAVDTTGNVYVVENAGNRVLKLPPGSNTPVVLPFTGLAAIGGVAVDTTGNVYVTDMNNHRVLELPAGSNTQVELPVDIVAWPLAVAVDATGYVYVTSGDGVLKLPPAGSRTTVEAESNTTVGVELPLTGDGKGVAVDNAGNVYVTDSDKVLKLPPGSNTPVVLPFTGLAAIGGVAVDTARNVYVTDGASNRVLKLPAG